jgi:hypothetical protein
MSSSSLTITLVGLLLAVLLPLQHASTAEAASLLHRIQPSRSLLQSAASDVPFVAQFNSLLSELGPGRPVTLKNVEAARFLSYAQAGAQASSGAHALWRQLRALPCQIYSATVPLMTYREVPAIAQQQKVGL